MADYSGLLKELLQQLETKNIRDPEIRKILQKIERNIATHLDGQQYAIRVGQNTADVIITNLLDGLDIPEYYKLEATIMPLLKNDHQLINELAARIQENLYEKANLGLNPIRPALEADRAEDLINAISDAENITKARNLVDSSLVDLVQHFDDKFIEDNARQEYRLGLWPKIRRMIAGGACRWCKALAGSYNYPDVPADVYRRHQNCRCIVTYDPGDGRRQNVHSKKWTPEEEFEQEERALEQSRKLKMDLQFFARTGKDRADEFRHNWTRASLKETIERLAPGAKSEVSPDGMKIYWKSPLSKFEIIEDNTGGNYFRIKDTTWKGKPGKAFRLLDGSEPFNVLENGKYRGRTPEERERVTHFYNTDTED